eukprot:6200965-Pleurochrysis_carterae.AAC.2
MGSILASGAGRHPATGGRRQQVLVLVGEGANKIDSAKHENKLRLKAPRRRGFPKCAQFKNRTPVKRSYSRL